MSKLTKALTAAAGNAGAGALYVDDVFSTYLYEGTGAAQTITNGIDLDGKGGLVWGKSRSQASTPFLTDTERGTNSQLATDRTNLAYTRTDAITSFNSDGFTLGSNANLNGSGRTQVAWTFRKAEKFFDVVTYTGDGVTGRTVSHNLGSTPGCIIVKNTTTNGFNWMVLHSSVGATGSRIYLNLADVYGPDPSLWNSTNPTSTEFTLGANPNVNSSGDTYVAYLFASDAGGFGDDGSESIIKCGSFVPASTWQSVIDIGFEPQCILYKKATSTGDWYIHDNMRGINTGSADPVLYPNKSDAEVDYIDSFSLHANGFEQTFSSVDTNTYIYIAIRRPMKTPESGTEVFNPTTAAVGTDITNNFAADLWFGNNTSGNGGANAHTFASRLTGLKWLQTATTLNETTASNSFYWDSNTEFTNSQFGGDRVEYFLKRATGFFDVVAYTGDGVTGRAITHNLGVNPELVIIKSRTNVVDWLVWQKDLGGVQPNQSMMYLNQTLGEFTTNYIFYGGTGTISSTEFGGLGGFNGSNGSGENLIAYLFATLDGVSKVGSYTGTGSNVDVDCGFSAGARFILIKRTDSTGDWYVWDSARGIVAGNDPYLLLNSTAAEVTSTDYIDPLSSGFTVTSSAPAALNASGGTYIFMAIS